MTEQATPHDVARLAFTFLEYHLRTKGLAFRDDLAPIVFHVLDAETWRFDAGAHGRLFQKGEADNPALRIYCKSQDLRNLLEGKPPVQMVHEGELEALQPLIEVLDQQRNPLSIRLPGKSKPKNKQRSR